MLISLKLWLQVRWILQKFSLQINLIMQCTKAKYLIYFYNQTCRSVIELSKIKPNTYNKEEESITHETQNNTLGKASAKNLVICIIIQVETYQDYTKLSLSQLSSSQYNPSLLLIDRIDKTYVFSSVLQASYFLAMFLWDDSPLTKWNTILTHYKTMQSSRNEFLLHARDFLIAKFLQLIVPCPCL